MRHRARSAQYMGNKGCCDLISYNVCACNTLSQGQCMSSVQAYQSELRAEGMQLRDYDFVSFQRQGDK